MRRDPDRSWGPDARPARADEVPGQLPRWRPDADSTGRAWGPLDMPVPIHKMPGYARAAAEEAQASGQQCLDARLHELTRRGWRVDSFGGTRVQLSAPSYRLPVWATVLLIVVTFGLWIVPAAWLQGSRRRDEMLLTIGPDHRLIETYTRGW